jgi:hypothetical protein
MIELPTTPDEFLALLQSIKDTGSGTVPYYTGYKNGKWLWKWQTHAWGSVSTDADYRNNGIVNEQDPFAKGTPNYIVHELLYNIVQNGLSETYEEGAIRKSAFRMLNRGEIGCMALSSDYFDDLRDAGVNPDDISFMPFPYNVDEQQYASVELDYCYAVNKNSAHNEEAKAWIDYMINKSGFSKSEGALSIRKKGGLPDVLANFKGVEFVVNTPATEENVGKYDELNDLSCLYLDTDAEKNRLVQSALGETDESFEDIMNDWSLRWKAAMQGIRYAVEKEPEEESKSDGEELFPGEPVFGDKAKKSEEPKPAPQQKPEAKPIPKPTPQSVSKPTPQPVQKPTPQTPQKPGQRPIPPALQRGPRPQMPPQMQNGGNKPESPQMQQRKLAPAPSQTSTK